MNARERGAKATEELMGSGVDCIIGSAVPETVTVLCAGGVMAYYEGKLLMLGEHVALTEEPVCIFVNDVKNSRRATVLV